MSIVVVGSIAFDSVSTPHGKREKSLGGAANYFAIAAQFYTKICMVGVVGEDFPKSHLELLKQKNIDISGIAQKAGYSFHWQGEYGFDLNSAQTLKTELNVFEDFLPQLPQSYRHAETVFLANIDPELQIHVLQQMTKPKIKALDTMNFWIERKLNQLKQAISMVDILFVNDAEIRSLTGEHNIIKAAKAALAIGAKIIVIKRGEYGALLFFDTHVAHVPAFLVEEVFDPTGAGDSFAGGFLGYLDTKDGFSINHLKEAMVAGTVMSSFAIEKFSFDRVLELDETMLSKRKEQLLALSHICL
ncbi:MAG: sugar kinase [Myxococcales bacterium]|nr:sugar kinase [Myxococcales bacterium]USN50792.1 MAG: sugar kinase [Myxococcales bacterium]